MRHDLHIHTTASDGVRSPTEIVEAAVRGRLDRIAITDHDTTAGFAEACAAAEALGMEDGPAIEVVPGIEVSSTWEGREIHILGYGVDPDSTAITGLDRRAHDRRYERMEEMVDRLRAQGVEVSMDHVLEVAGPDRHMLARPHLAGALIEVGYAESKSEAFDRWIADGHPAFVATNLGDPALAIETIRAAGGIASWAHPPLDLLSGLLPTLVDAGLRGIEAYRPNHTRPTLRKMRAAARAHDLVVTGGSDWHNPDRNDPLGAFWVTSGQLRDFREEVGWAD